MYTVSLRNVIVFENEALHALFFFQDIWKVVYAIF